MWIYSSDRCDADRKPKHFHSFWGVGKKGPFLPMAGDVGACVSRARRIRRSARTVRLAMAHGFLLVISSRVKRQCFVEAVGYYKIRCESSLATGFTLVNLRDRAESPDEVLFALRGMRSA